MQDVMAYAAWALTVIGALAVVGFESPIRCAGGLVTAFAGAAGLAGTVEAPFAPGLFLLVGSSVGIVLVAAVLVLGPTADGIGNDRHRRRVRLRSALAVPVVGLLFALLAGTLLPAAGGAPPPRPADVALALADERAGALGLVLLALAVSVVVSIALLRRRT